MRRNCVLVLSTQTDTKHTHTHISWRWQLNCILRWYGQIGKCHCMHNKCARWFLNWKLKRGNCGAVWCGVGASTKILWSLVWKFECSHYTYIISLRIHLTPANTHLTTIAHRFVWVGASEYTRCQKWKNFCKNQFQFQKHLKVLRPCELNFTSTVRRIVFKL